MLPDYTLVRSRRRTLELRVYPDHRIEVRAPLRTSRRDIDEFVRSRRGWIQRRLRTLEQRPPPPAYRQGCRHPFLGDHLPLEIEASGRTRVRFHGDRIHVAVPDPQSEETVANALLEAYRREAKRYFPRLIDNAFDWFADNGHRRPVLRVKNMKTRWGSLSSRGYINLNLQLMQLPPDCIEYVIMHELCHLEHMHHGPAFHALMDERMPDWRVRSQRLREQFP